MKIFLYEHITGGGLCGETVPTSLAQEGQAMLSAFADDLSRVDGVSVTVLWDGQLGDGQLGDGLMDAGRLAGADLPAGVRRLLVRTPAEARSTFERVLDETDATCIIAPELGGQLARLSRRVVGSGRRLLGATAESIDLACDKLRLPQFLSQHGIAAIPALPFSSELLRSEGLGQRRFVVKPRRGAGSTDVFVLKNPSDLAALPQFSDDMVANPWCQGVAASVLVLVGADVAVPLLPSRQRLSGDGRLAYLGGRLPLDTEFAERARQLALSTVRAVPGLRGFIGVDLLLATDESHTGDVVVELNARLTTSYVGLRVLARENLARLWLDVLDGKDVTPPSWEPHAVDFFPNGRVETLVP